MSSVRAHCTLPLRYKNAVQSARKVCPANTKCKAHVISKNIVEIGKVWLWQLLAVIMMLYLKSR